MASNDAAILVAAAAAGDSDAWEELVQRFGEVVWSVARGAGLNATDAADVVQTTWLRLAENLDRIRDPSRLVGWLATTARNEAYRSHRSGSRVDQYEDVPLEREPEIEGIDAKLLTSERDHVLWAAFRQLSEKCQELLRLLTASPELSYAETSGLLGMPIGSIGPTRRRCLDSLRAMPEMKELQDELG